MVMNILGWVLVGVLLAPMVLASVVLVGAALGVPGLSVRSKSRLQFPEEYPYEFADEPVVTLAGRGSAEQRETADESDQQLQILP
jgi:hypothetical protein